MHIDAHMTITGGSLPRVREDAVLLVLGSGPGGMEDGLRFAESVPCAVLAVNDMIPAWPRHLDLAASWHAAFLAAETPPGRLFPWLRARTRMDRNAPAMVFAPREHQGVSRALTFHRPVGSSAMFAVLAGKALGFSLVVTTGVSLDGHYRAFLPAWESALAAGLLDGVRCLTPGPLQDLLGAADTFFPSTSSPTVAGGRIPLVRPPAAPLQELRA